jgi:hypothetical protein
MKDYIANFSIDDEHRYGGLLLRELPEVKKNFRENALKVLVETGADHAAYCHIAYNEDGEITAAHFYSKLPMDDATFCERTRTIPGTDYVGAVHKRI